MANCIEATLCYIRRKDEVLMLHRNTRPDDLHYGRYNGLGGKCEPGESPWQCALREIREESGLQPQRLRFAGHILFPLFDGKQDWSVFLFCGYEAVGELLGTRERRNAGVGTPRASAATSSLGRRPSLPPLGTCRATLSRPF